MAIRTKSRRLRSDEDSTFDGHVLRNRIFIQDSIENIEARNYTFKGDVIDALSDISVTICFKR